MKLNSAHFPTKLELLEFQINNLTSLDISFIPSGSFIVHAQDNLISNFYCRAAFLYLQEHTECDRAMLRWLVGVDASANKTSKRL